MFLRGAEAWQRVSRDARQLYVCPLCIRGFDVNALAARVLSLEHVPPRSIGGKPLALTCRDCNSTAGHRIDAAGSAYEHLASLTEAMFRSGENVRGTATLHLNELPPINVEYDASVGDLKLNVMRDRNNPTVFERHFATVERAIQDGTSGDFKFRFTPNTRVHARRALVSHLRAAYLVLFAGLGYRYALSTRLALVREQLSKVDEPILEHAWIRTDEKVTRAPLILGLTEPTKAFAVVLPRVTVLMPTISGPEDPWALFGETSSEGRITLTGRPLGWPKALEMQYDFQ
jgi:hypothetical protein